MVALRAAVARAKRALLKHPDDALTRAAYAAAREDYATAMAVYRLRDTLDGVPLGAVSRRRIVEAVLSA
jgi:hypothetical protein